jgi:acetyltransferase-like isoleucine patch superfamily enzyme
VIGKAAHVGPGACLAGAVHIGACALMGVGSSARPGSSVGEGAIVGAGSSVVTDIAPHATAVGVPARPMNGKS